MAQQAQAAARPAWAQRMLLVMEASFALFFLYLVILCASHKEFISAWVFGAGALGITFDYSKHWHGK